MITRKFSGYWIIVGTITVAAMLAAYFKGAEIDPSAFRRMMVVLLFGTILLLLRAPLAGAWRLVARLAPRRQPDEYKRDPSATVGAVDDLDADVIVQRFANLK